MKYKFIRRAGVSLLLLSSLLSLSLPAGADGVDINNAPAIDGADVSTAPEAENPSLPPAEETPSAGENEADPPVKEPLVLNNASDWAVQNLQEADMLNLLPDILRSADMKEDITRREMCYLATTALSLIHI